MWKNNNVANHQPAMIGPMAKNPTGCRTPLAIVSTRSLQETRCHHVGIATGAAGNRPQLPKINAEAEVSQIQVSHGSLQLHVTAKV